MKKKFDEEINHLLVVVEEINHFLVKRMPMQDEENSSSTLLRVKRGIEVKSSSHYCLVHIKAQFFNLFFSDNFRQFSDFRWLKKQTKMS